MRVAPTMLLLAAAACQPDPCKTTGISIQTGEVMDSIPEALEAAGPGGVVHLCAGTYDGEGLDLGNGVSLLGAGAEETVIDLDRHYDASDHLTIERLLVYDEPRVTISDLTVTGGSNAPTDASGIGGAIEIGGGDLLLERVKFDDNYATFGGAMGIGTTASAFASVTLRDSEFSSNHAFGAGAIAIWSAASVVVEDTNFGPAERSPKIGIYATLPHLDDPSSDPVATFNFEGTVSFTCAWETATCE